MGRRGKGKTIKEGEDGEKDGKKRGGRMERREGGGWREGSGKDGEKRGGRMKIEGEGRMERRGGEGWREWEH